MKLVIEKRSYSSHPWRLVDADTGNEIVHPERWDHPDAGPTETSEPVCGRTKDEVVQKALGLLAYAAERLRKNCAIH
jgi:hypothetical protein